MICVAQATSIGNHRRVCLPWRGNSQFTTNVACKTRKSSDVRLVSLSIAMRPRNKKVGFRVPVVHNLKKGSHH